MAPSRAYRRPFGHFFAITLLLGIILLFVQPATSNPSEQTADGEELICHTDDPAQCYPRVFQATDEFQVVKPDQEIPSGLHVRLNIWTGEKEAKINVLDDNDPALDGLPVDSGVVVVDQEAQPHAEPRIPKDAPEYEPVGAIKEPPVEEAGFWESLDVIKKWPAVGVAEVKAALENLELSSDIYYGLKLTEDSEAVKSLFCLMVGHDASGATLDDRQAAARILGGAVQNNIKALAEIEKNWAGLMASTCPSASHDLETAFYASFMPTADDLAGLSAEEYARAVSRAGSAVFAAKGLIKNAAIRDDFIAKGGMKNLLEVLAVRDERWAPAQRKVGHLLLDTFLDAEGGATLGVWPTGEPASDAVCANGEVQEGCVEFYVKSIMERNKGEQGHWSVEVYDRLRAARKANAEKDGKLEL